MKNTSMKVLFLAMMLNAYPAQAQQSYSPTVGIDFPTNVYWGDTHLHTNLSLDAYSKGNNALAPDDAYRFAKGESITANNGMKVQLHRPLDFLVVADHAIGLGMFARLQAKDPILLGTKNGQTLNKDFKNISGDTEKVRKALRQLYARMVSSEENEEVRDEGYRHSVWQEVAQSADRNNTPGEFTAFIGFEWTPHDPASYHRVVIFEDGADRATKTLPFSRTDSTDPEELWAYLEDYQRETGGEVLAIPHNANLTGGMMFSPTNFAGNPLNGAYAKRRQLWEPLLEVTQIKGDSETYPVLSPDDPFADYETWNSWSGRSLGYEWVETENGEWKKGEEKTWNEEEVSKKQFEYARSALKLGLSHQAQLGTNPFKFGMIGSTDSHTSLSGVAENNFLGKYTKTEPSPDRMFASGATAFPDIGWQNAAQGYAAVWAHENTRESLFAAMKRKEVYATTGPRMTVRFFGGWDYETEDAHRPDLARIGYAKGVPMGGDLTHAPDGRTPRFLIRAVRDPDGANLDRVQVIKGWRSSDGELHEKIYDVALSDGRKVRWRGGVKPVGSTVDVTDASYTNDIGDPELAVVWEDPDFNKEELAFYYVRVIEIPTPRWTAYDAKYFDIALDDIPDEVPMITQERAYSSPIWYSP